MKLKDVLAKAQQVKQNWTDDDSIYLDDNEEVALEAVPEWTESLTHLEVSTLETLQREFELYYNTPAPATIEGLLKATKAYKFTIATISGNTYALTANPDTYIN